jgi:hypothetical protein
MGLINKVEHPAQKSSDNADCERSEQVSIVAQSCAGQRDRNMQKHQQKELFSYRLQYPKSQQTGSP